MHQYSSVSEMQTYAKPSGGVGRRSIRAQALEFLGGGQGQLGWWTWVLSQAFDQLIFFSPFESQIIFTVFIT